MGAWGFGIYDNDAALDARDIVEDLVDRGLTYEEAFEAIETIHWILETPPAVLVLADMQIENLGRLAGAIGDRVLDVIEGELELLDRWDEPLERERVLLNFKRKVEPYYMKFVKGDI